MVITIIKTWKKTEENILKMNEEEYGISNGCCFFHDMDELLGFTDIDDEEEVKEIVDVDEINLEEYL